MKVALAQLNFHIGFFEQNEQKIIHTIDKARAQQADLVIFSELAVCGYPPKDLLERKDFVEKIYASLDRIREATKDIAIIIGAPALNPKRKGKNLFNSAYFIYNQQIEQVEHKTLLPTYDVFDEYRYFQPNKKFHIVEFKGRRLALTICEDLWEKQPINNHFAKEELYTISPMEQLKKQNPDLIVNISASPFSYTKEDDRHDTLTAVCQKYKLPLVYVNQVGAHAELIFDGDSRVYSKKGKLKLQMKQFVEDFHVIDIATFADKKTIKPEAPTDIQQIHDALVLGVKDYFQKMNFSKATLGLSGGIDSAVTLAIAQRALGSENLHVLLMPSGFSSDHSVNDAVAMAKHLQIGYDIVNIQESYEAIKESLAPIFQDRPFDVTEENIQARIRGLLLMAYSNKFGHILLNTSNKSESAVGYGTLYGDMNGGLSVLGDVYKTKVFELAHFINKDEEIIPMNTITKPPSAELRPDQKDSDSLPDYDILDKILTRYIEYNMSALEIIAEGFDSQTVCRLIEMTNRNEYKRFQTPPILRVTSKAFGFGRKIPLVCKF